MLSYLVDLCVRKPYKNYTFGCKVQQKAYKTNALEHQLPKHDFSKKHFLLVFIGPDAVLQIHLLNFSVGVKSFAHRTLLYFPSKMITHKWDFFIENRSRIERYYARSAVVRFGPVFINKSTLYLNVFFRA